MKAETANQFKFHFLSDLHLGSSHEPNFLLFLNYLKSLSEKKVTHLFLLGDIFDLWVGDQKYFVEKYKPIVEELKSLSKSGVEIHYFEGNHDFLFRNFWQKEVGVYVYDGPQRLEICGLNLLLAHGDQIDKDDIGYIRLRKFFRSGLAKFIVFNLPEVITRKVGEFADKKSHGQNLRDPEDKKRVVNLVRKYAETSYKNMPFDYCFTGHFHVKDEYCVIDSAKSINLGTWLDEPSFYEVTSNSSKFITLNKATSS